MRRIIGFLLLFIGVAVVAVGVTILLVRDGDDGTTTTVAAATSAVETTTTATTVAPPATTAATSTEPPTTTSVATSLTLGPSGVGVADFGDEPDSVIAAVAGVIGPPASDAGWASHPIVDGAEYRWAVWGDGLFLWFGDNPTAYGASGFKHFQGYEYFGSPTGLLTPEGIGVGDQVGTLLTAYGNAELVLNALTQQEYRYQIHPSGTSDFLCFDVGLQVPTDATLIESIWAGRECTYGGE